MRLIGMLISLADPLIPAFAVVYVGPPGLSKERTARLISQADPLIPAFAGVYAGGAGPQGSVRT